MRTIILSGGKGTRMYEHTEFMPKPLVPIAGRPILYHIIDMYVSHGFTEFDIAGGYKGEMIREYLMQNPYQEDVDIKYHDTGIETQTGGRVKLVNPQDTFMVTYGDGVSDIDISALARFHMEQREVFPLTISGARARSRYGKLVLGEGNAVIAMEEKPWLDDYVNCGFWVCEPELVERIDPEKSTEVWCGMLSKEGKVNAFLHDGFWFGCDTYKDYLRLNNLYQEHNSWQIPTEVKG